MRAKNQTTRQLAVLYNATGKAKSVAADKLAAPCFGSVDAVEADPKPKA